MNVKPLAEQHLEKLQKYSAKHGNLTPLEGFDVEYWKNRYISEKFA